MTATFNTISASANTSNTTVDIGTVQDEDQTVNAGTVAITVAFQDSSETYTYNLSGVNRVINVRGIKADTATNLRTFTDDLYKIVRYQNTTANDSYFTYTNNKSHENDIYAGIRVKILDYSTSQTSNDAVNMLAYGIRLVESK